MIPDFPESPLEPRDPPRDEDDEPIHEFDFDFVDDEDEDLPKKHEQYQGPPEPDIAFAEAP